MGVKLAGGLRGFLICTGVLGAFGTSTAASMQASRLSLCGTVCLRASVVNSHMRHNTTTVTCHATDLAIQIWAPKLGTVLPVSVERIEPPWVALIED